MYIKYKSKQKSSTAKQIIYLTLHLPIQRLCVFEYNKEFDLIFGLWLIIHKIYSKVSLNKNKNDKIHRIQANN